MMYAHQSQFGSRGRERSFPKFASPILLPSVPSSPESNPIKSPEFSQRTSFDTLEQLQHYEDCIAKVSSEVAVSRDACVALQERLCASDSELCEKVATIDHLIAEKHQLNHELREKDAIIEALKSQNIQKTEEQALVKKREVLASQKTIDETYEKALLERDDTIKALTCTNEEKELCISRLEATILKLKGEQQVNHAFQVTGQSQQSEILRLQKSLQESESSVKSLQQTLKEEQLLTQMLMEDKKSHRAIEDAKQFHQQNEITQLEESLQASKSAAKSLQQLLQEEQLITQKLKEDQIAHLAIQDARQFYEQSEISRLQESILTLESTVASLQRALQQKEQQLTQLLKEDQKEHLAIQDFRQSQLQLEILRLQESLQTSESDCKSFKFALQEERLLNQKFGKVEHLLSANSMISAASQSFVVAELEAEKKLSERLKAALQESTDINSRMLLANSAYQDKTEELQARVISCNAFVWLSICILMMTRQQIDKLS
jgi:hypothetical protein